MKNVITKFFCPCGFPAIVLLFAVVFCALFFSCKPTPKDLTIFYDMPLEEVQKIAKEDEKVFCVVLTKPDCPPCANMVKSLGERYGHLESKVVFNVVDVSLPENQWYSHWLCVGAFPTTCVFSADGELQTSITCATSACQQCITSAIEGDFKCASFFENSQFPAKGKQSITMLNTLLSCKRNLEQGKDISAEIEPFLKQNVYPYSLFLKCLNEEKQGRHEEAVYWAKRMMEIEDSYYNFVYDTLYKKVKTMINPNYADEASVLSVVEELTLEGCEYKQSKPFSLTLTNIGKSPIAIRDIVVGCSCMKLLSEKPQSIQPNQSIKIDLAFTPDARGDVFREVTIFSDAKNAMQDVKIFAVVR